MITAVANDKQLVINILAAAFDGNKSVNAIVRQDSLRNIRIRHLMAYAFHVCLKFGKVYLSNDGKACALLLFPERKQISLKAIWWDLKLVWQVIGFRQVVKVMARERQLRAVHPKERMAYLWFIGVDPNCERAGHGKKLMLEIIAAQEADERRIYLETSTVINVSWYEKLGFQIYHTLDLGYVLFFLRR
jgi:ribosomal protein S18 acetylase RimI-like enzyme